MKKLYALILVCLVIFAAGCAPQTDPAGSSGPTTVPSTIPTPKPTTRPIVDVDAYSSRFMNYNIWYYDVHYDIRWDSDVWDKTGMDYDVLIFSLTYPKIHLKENHTAAQAIVAADLNRRLDEFMLKTEDWIREAYEDSIYYTYCSRFADFDIVSIEEHEDQQIISVHYIISTQLGGPHPNSPSYQVTYDSITGEILMLDDIIDTGKAEELYQLVCDGLPTNVDYTEDPAQVIKEEFFTDLSKTDNWKLTEKGLCFSFNTYVLAPHAYGTIGVVIPYEELSSILLPQYMPQ